MFRPMRFVLVAMPILTLPALAQPPLAGDGPLPDPDCGSRSILGDMNCDNLFNNFDIDAMVEALVNPEEYLVHFPGCSLLNGDANGDGRLDNFDIDPFVDLIISQPRVFADAGGPYAAVCNGATVSIQLDGRCSRSIDASLLEFSWTSTCPGATFDDPTISTPVITIPTNGSCVQECFVTVRVTAVSPPAGGVGSNVSERTAHIAITDDTPPSMTAPADAAVECGTGSTTPDATGIPEVSDNCDQNPAVTFEDGPSEGGIIRTWTARDACGNTTTRTQNIFIVDTTPPAFTQCPGQISVTADNEVGVPVDSVVLTVTATDACGGEPLILDNRPNAFYPIGSTSVTFVAFDNSENTSTCVVKVLVNPPGGDNNNNNNNNNNGNNNTNDNGNTNGNTNDNGNTNGNTNDNGNTNGNSNTNTNTNTNTNSNDNANRPAPDANTNSNSNSNANTNGNDGTDQAGRSDKFQEEYIITVMRTPLCGPIGFASLGLMFAGLGACRRYWRRGV